MENSPLSKAVSDLTPDKLILKEAARGFPNGGAAPLAGPSRRRGLAVLAFLAPDIVEAIAAGRRPVALTSDALVKAERRASGSTSGP